MTRMFFVALMGVMMLTCGSAYAETVDFEDLMLEAESYYNGDDGAGSFESGGVVFNNFYDDTYGPYWEGFAYTNATDTTTLDYANQYSAITGSGSNGTGNYAVAYLGFYGIVPTITLPKEARVARVDITNTTYAFLTMQEGYFSAKKFGGETGNDEDWFLLTITGKDSDGNVVGSVEFYLADFRFDDNTQDYIIHEWTPVELSGLGPVKSLEFSLSSSDNDLVFGMNTPAYFAVDSIEYYASDGSDDGLGCFIGVSRAGVF